MQLIAENNLEQAIEELRLALPIEALRSIIRDRQRKHKPRAKLRHELAKLRAEQMRAA